MTFNYNINQKLIQINRNLKNKLKIFENKVISLKL